MFTPPPLAPHTVRRERLLSLLDLAAGQRLSLIVSPPGSGKTTLLAQWVASRPDAQVRWLSLTGAHDAAEPLAAALVRLLDGSPAGVAGSGPTDATPLRRLGSALAGFAEQPPTYLVVDNLHVLTNDDVLAELAELFRDAPPSLRVLAATQVDPPRDYYRIGLSDLPVELRQEDLAFTRAEAAELVEAVAGFTPTDRHVDVLQGATEGWAAGLELAARLLGGADDVDSVAAALPHDDGVHTFFQERVLDGLDADTHHFLTATSVLHELHGSLCDAVTGQPGSRAILDDLVDRSMFISRTAGRPRSFRYHPLFRAALRRLLRAEEPDGERRLLRVAADWHLARDEVEEGVDYLIDAEAWDDVLDVALSPRRPLHAESRVNAVGRWTEQIPDAIAVDRVEVALLHAAAIIFAGPAEQLPAVLPALEVAATRSSGARVVTDTLLAFWALIQGETGEALARARAARRLVHTPDVELPNVLGVTGTRADIDALCEAIIGTALLHDGSPGDAARHLTAATDDGHPCWELVRRGSLALAEAWSGRLTVAERLGRQTLDLGRQLGLDREPVVSARIALAHVAIERGQTDEGAKVLDEVQALLDERRRPVLAALVTIDGATAHLVAGDPFAGLELLAASTRPDTPALPAGVRLRWQAVEAQLRLAGGDIAGAAALLDRVDDPDADIAAARVRLAVDRGDVSGAQAVIDGWPADATARSLRLRALWQAVLDDLAGNDVEARLGLAQVVAEAEEEDDVGLFRVVGQHAVGLTRAMFRTAPTAFLRTITERPPALDGSRSRAAKDLVEQLTDREFMVLTVLPTRLSNVEIGERLGISLNTVKAHLKHIYRKLGVAGRAQAVAEAERLRLI